MMPDKIYLPKEEIEERMPWIATPYEDDPNWDECYIRKDALMEWLRKLNETYHKEYETSRYTCGEHWGQMVAFQKAIDKINEM